MSTIVTRAGKGSPLSNAEVDSNFSNLNTDKLELGGTFSSGTANSILFLNGSKVLTTGSALSFDGSRVALSTATANIQLTTTVNTNQAYLSLADADGRTAVFRGPNSGSPNAAQIGTTTNHDLIFLYGNAEAMRLASTGLTVQQGAVFNESGADSDFRVESDLNTHMLFVDGGNDAVGIGMVPLTTFGNRNSLEIGGNTVANLSLQAAIAETLYNFYINGSGQSVYSTDGPAGFQSFNNVVSAGWSFQTYPSGTAGGLAPAGTDLLALSPNGTIFNEGGADIDFRVESDTNTHALFVDAGNSKVGFNFNAPTNILHAGVASAASLGSSSDGLVVTATSGTAYNTQLVRLGDSYNYAGATGAPTVGAAMLYNYGGRFFFVGDGASASDFVFTTYGANRLQVGSDSYALVVNEDGLDYDFRVESDTNTHAFFLDAAVSRFGFNSASTPTTVSLAGATGVDFGFSLSPSGWNDALHRLTVPVSGDTSVWSFNYSGSAVDFSGYATSSIQVGQGAIIFGTGAVNTAPSEKFKVALSEAVFNEGGLDYDFRVESDTSTHALFVDAGNSWVGINNSSPVAPLSITSPADGSPALTTSFTRLYTFSGSVLEANNYQIFKVTVNDIRVNALLRISLQSDNLAGIGRLVGSIMEVSVSRVDGGAAFNVKSVSDGNISLSEPVVSGNDIIFGAFNSNNGTSININYACSVELVSTSPGSFVFADIAPGTAHTGANWIDQTRIYRGSSIPELLMLTGETVFNENGNDQDFRVESDNNTHALFVQGSDGNVGIGTSSPSEKLEVVGVAKIRTSGGSGVQIVSAATPYIQAFGASGNNVLQLNGQSIVFWSGASYGAESERARITSGGYFKASNAGTYAGSTAAYHELRSNNADYTALITNTNATPYGLYVGYDQTPNGTGNQFLLCIDGTATRAEIRSNGGLANYQSNNVDLSDIRTKTDISPLASYWNKIAALEIVTYKYKDQTHDDLNIGVIAQQVEQVAPEFVDTDGFGDTPEDGVPLKTVYNKDLTFAAIKALQEAMARIEQLEAKVAALEGK